ncbi:ATP-binding protein [Streptomyces atriruber]|uniref:ATP-binding protein n=1 Tax=Streptomyces atriruber TaxID=545121 RepID=UPI0006E39025|nr:ATP-binding protein [Streptomyces atriruber]
MPLSRQRRFSRDGRSVGAARAFAVETLDEWGITVRQDDIRLCVSELATNAVLHGALPGREFCLRIIADDAIVRIEVRDSGSGRPEVPCAAVDADEEGGRGLLLATTLSDDFGVTAHVSGKTVWLVFKVGLAV